MQFGSLHLQIGPSNQGRVIHHIFCGADLVPKTHSFLAQLKPCCAVLTMPCMDLFCVTLGVGGAGE